jgi:1-deoxy-D-xylulose-5-phosphate reductoisomerase
VPIAVALAHPERVPLDVPRLDLAELARLDFAAPDRARFPALDLAFRALESPASGGSEAAPAVLNAANEVAVARFLKGEIPLPRICEVNGRVMEEHLAESPGAVVEELDDVLQADAWARERAEMLLSQDAPRTQGAARVVGAMS